jgi:hypothetical protein
VESLRSIIIRFSLFDKHRKAKVPFWPNWPCFKIALSFVANPDVVDANINRQGSRRKLFAFSDLESRLDVALSLSFPIGLGVSHFDFFKFVTYNNRRQAGIIGARSGRLILSDSYIV